MDRGDETFSHPTGFGEVYGFNADAVDWPQAEGLEYVHWMADSTRALLDQGVDIIELLSRGRTASRSRSTASRARTACASWGSSW